MLFMKPGLRICFNDGSILYLNKEQLTAREDGVYTGTFWGISIMWKAVLLTFSGSNREKTLC